jgi:mannonate dehydratase
MPDSQAPSPSVTDLGVKRLIITGVRVVVTCPGRNFVTVKIETADGIYGLGDATLNGRELSVVSYIEDHIAPCLIGRDAHQIEDIWQFH